MYFVAVPAGIVGLALGLLALRRPQSVRRVAFGGIMLSLIGLVVGLGVVAFLVLDDDSRTTTINLTRSTLCIRDVATGFNWNEANTNCYTNFSGGQLCTLNQLRKACALGGFPVLNNRWLADRVSDDGAVHTNMASCTNPDGTSNYQDSRSSYCCLEWMKY